MVFFIKDIFVEARDGLELIGNEMIGVVFFLRHSKLGLNGEEMTAFYDT